jgi:hypothetical protein
MNPSIVSRACIRSAQPFVMCKKATEPLFALLHRAVVCRVAMG